MFIILEGVDCAGKSFVGEHLSKSIPNSFYIKQCNTPKSAHSEEEISILKISYESILNFYRSYVAPINGNLVVDRYYPSELVYSRVMRSYDAFEDPYYNNLEKLISKLEYRLLYVHAPMEEIQKRMELRGDNYVDFDQLGRLSRRYQDFLRKTKLKNIRTVLSGSTEVDDFIQKEVIK